MIRAYDEKDYDFLKCMLFEAVYWRSQIKPEFEASLKLKGIIEAHDNFGSKRGDVCYIDEDYTLRGAAWYRLYDDNNHIRGYIDQTIPVIVIAVHQDFRKRGIGLGLLDRLVKRGRIDGYHALSLCVSKDNHALKLYEKLGFEIYKDIGDSLIMKYTFI